MSTFTLFPELPLELREMIWIASIQPRPVQVWVQPETRDQYSGSPIPYTLHTCKESRATLLANGYTLAFGTPAQEPQVWFNFTHDILYLPIFEFCYSFEPGAGHSVHPEWLLERFTKEDAARVKRLGMAGSLNNMRSFMNSYGEQFNPALQHFSNVEDLLFVETVLGKRTACPSIRSFRDDRHDPLGWVECDVAEAQRKCPYDGDILSDEYMNRIASYKKEHKNDGQFFFRDLVAQFEGELTRIRDQAVREGLASWMIPKVKNVQIMREFCASRMLYNRRRYWVELEEEERLDAIRMSRPKSPFTAQHADEFDVLENDFGIEPGSWW